jgi:hypothetical protein
MNSLVDEKSYESESSIAYKDAGIFLDAPEETKSSWRFLFLSPS